MTKDKHWTDQLDDLDFDWDEFEADFGFYPDDLPSNAELQCAMEGHIWVDTGMGWFSFCKRCNADFEKEEK